MTEELIGCAECGADGGHALYCVVCAEKYVVQTKTKDEPVAWEQFHEHMAGPNYVAPQRTWVGLTEEEIKECFALTPDQHLPWQIYKRIEAKLKDKNT
jgi:hypothetical protein